MSQIVEVLFAPPAYHRSPLGLLRWWESRRLLYNGVVGASGLVSLGITELIAWLPPGPHHYLPLVGVLVFGVAANVCYTAGWLVETAAERVWGREAPLLGPALFRQGLSFSVGLTLLPSALSVFAWLIRVVTALR